MAIGANNLLMLALSNYRRKLFDLQTFQNQAHIISVTGIIIYFLGTYYLYTEKLVDVKRREGPLTQICK